MGRAGDTTQLFIYPFDRWRFSVISFQRIVFFDFVIRQITGKSNRPLTETDNWDYSALCWSFSLIALVFWEEKRVQTAMLVTIGSPTQELLWLCSCGVVVVVAGWTLRRSILCNDSGQIVHRNMPLYASTNNRRRHYVFWPSVCLSVRPSVCRLTPVSCDAISLHSVKRFQWDLPYMYVGISRLPS